MFSVIATVPVVGRKNTNPVAGGDPEIVKYEAMEWVAGASTSSDNYTYLAPMSASTFAVLKCGNDTLTTMTWNSATETITTVGNVKGLGARSNQCCVVRMASNRVFIADPTQVGFVMEWDGTDWSLVGSTTTSIFTGTPISIENYSNGAYLADNKIFFHSGHQTGGYEMCIVEFDGTSCSVTDTPVPTPQATNYWAGFSWNASTIGGRSTIGAQDSFITFTHNGTSWTSVSTINRTIWSKSWENEAGLYVGCAVHTSPTAIAYGASASCFLMWTSASGLAFHRFDGSTWDTEGTPFESISSGQSFAAGSWPKQVIQLTPTIFAWTDWLAETIAVIRASVSTA